IAVRVHLGKAHGTAFAHERLSAAVCVSGAGNELGKRVHLDPIHVSAFISIRSGQSVHDRMTVALPASTPPNPWASAVRAFSTCRLPHSPRNWRTASTSKKIPNIPGWQ